MKSQKRLQAEELRREANEKRKEKKHKMQIWLLQAEGEHREMKNNELDPRLTSAQTRVDRIRAHENAAYSSVFAIPNDARTPKPRLHPAMPPHISDAPISDAAGSHLLRR